GGNLHSLKTSGLRPLGLAHVQPTRFLITLLDLPAAASQKCGWLTAARILANAATILWFRIAHDQPVARVGVEPTAFPGLSRDGLPVAYLADSILGGIQTHYLHRGSVAATTPAQLG